MSNMMRKEPDYFSWRLKLILALGCLGGLLVGLFSLYVTSLPDVSTLPTPLSWKFKSNSASVAAAFATGTDMSNKQLSEPLRPAMDQAFPKETELALFALG